jgi:hypothetical protein
VEQEEWMVAFEISINGERRCVGEEITAVTVVADWVHKRHAERVSIHVGGAEGSGYSGETQPQWLGAHLRAGDEVLIRIVEVVEEVPAGTRDCSFCGAGNRDIASLVQGLQVGICNGCIASFDAFLKSRAQLPLGASIQDQPDQECGFCGKQSGEIAGLLTRNGAAICAECLRSCSDLIADHS